VIDILMTGDRSFDIVRHHVFYSGIKSKVFSLSFSFRAIIDIGFGELLNLISRPKWT